jgi:RNA polymerase sigma factor (sigma-70 family)
VIPLNRAYGEYRIHGDKEKFGSVLLAFIKKGVASEARIRFHLEDAVGEAFLAVWEKLGDFEPAGPATFETWVTSILLHKAIDIKRNSARRREQPYVGNEHIHTDYATKLTIKALLKELPSRDRAFIQMKLDGCTNSEIGVALQYTLGFVDIKWHRLQRRLRTLWGGNLGEDL